MLLITKLFKKVENIKKFKRYPLNFSNSIYMDSYFLSEKFSLHPNLMS